MNYINLNIVDSKYRLPNLDTIHNNLSNRIETIKNNNYVLPTITEKTNNKDSLSDRKAIPITIPFRFTDSNSIDFLNNNS